MEECESGSIPASHSHVSERPTLKTGSALQPDTDHHECDSIEHIEV